jgi:hypothetical protein
LQTAGYPDRGAQPVLDVEPQALDPIAASAGLPAAGSAVTCQLVTPEQRTRFLP